MTYIVFGETLSLTQSINQPLRAGVSLSAPPNTLVRPMHHERSF